MCFLCPNPLVKMDIISSQNKHFVQVGPSKRSWFVVVFLNCMYPLMCVDTSINVTCVHLFCCAHDNECRGTHEICGIFVAIARDASFHVGRKHYMHFFQPCSTLFVNELTLGWNSHLNQCCHCQSNTSGFTLSILRNLRICCFWSSSSQRKELLWLTLH
jgi:hypothetical protein